MGFELTMDFSVPGRMFRKISIITALFCIIGSACVGGVTYQVEPESMIPDADLDFESICISANQGLSCVSNADGSLLQPYFLPATKASCSSVVVKAFIIENLGYWKCIVVNVGPASPSNPERVVLFGNDTASGSSPLDNTFLPSLIALGPTPNVEAHVEAALGSSSIKAAVNATVNLTCSSDSTTPSQFIWEYRNATTGLWRVFSHAQNLTVSGVFGELWCSAWNKLGPVRSASTITIQQDLGPNTSTLPVMSHFLTKFLVFGPPAKVEAHTVTGEKEVKASILQPVNMYCSSDATMPSRYIWEYRSATTGLWKIFSHGQYLTVNGVYGDFWCTAWNMFGPSRSENSITVSPTPAGPATPLLAMKSPFLSSFIAVSEPPVISVEASFETEGQVWEAATYNDTINLYCASNASWFSRYIWFYRNNATGALRILKAGQNATVHGLFGEFWCSVWNRFGATPSTTTLQILHAPEWVDISSPSGEENIISILKNETINLTCNSDAYPGADYRWERRDIGKPWKIVGLTKEISVPGKKGGEYICVASNSLGEKSSSEVVVVVEPLVKLATQPGLLFAAKTNTEGSTEGVESGIAIVGGGLVAAVLILLVVLGFTVNRYRKRGTYKELKKTVQRPEDSHDADERRSLIAMGVPY